MLLASRPVWARELKLAWLSGLTVSWLSRPVWARELKHDLLRLYAVVAASRPVWARELKPRIAGLIKSAFGRAPCGRVN